MVYFVFKMVNFVFKMMSGLQVWVLTGDKEEPAINCALKMMDFALKTMNYVLQCANR